MDHLLFTIYDEKAEVFLPPFFVPTIGIARRAFTDCINSDSHVMGKHPADYTLFKLGAFDDSNAEIAGTAKTMIGNGVEFINPEHVDSLGEFRDGPPDPPIQSDKDS